MKGKLYQWQGKNKKESEKMLRKGLNGIIILDGLPDEWNEDLTILGQLLRWECLLVPLVVCECARAEICDSPHEECHGSRCK